MLQSPPDAPQRTSQFSDPRRRARLWLALVLLGTVLLVLGPFALAGMTGNALWIVLPIIPTLAYAALRETPRCLAYYRSLLIPVGRYPAWLPTLGYTVLALSVTLGVGALLSLVRAGTPLDWSLGTLFRIGAAAGENGFAIPFSSPLLALVYVPAALLALPLLAYWEEDIFRRGTTDIRSALNRSIVFGLAHLTAGVSLGGCIALGGAGLVFSHAYTRALHDPHAEEHRRRLPMWVRARLLPEPIPSPDGAPTPGSRARRRQPQNYAVYRATQVHLLYNVIGVVLIVALSR